MVKFAYVVFNVFYFVDFVCEVLILIVEGGREVCRIYYFS